MARQVMAAPSEAYARADFGQAANRPAAGERKEATPTTRGLVTLVPEGETPDESAGASRVQGTTMMVFSERLAPVPRTLRE
jgi:hypothetical protein